MGVTMPVWSARALMSWVALMAVVGWGTARATTPEELAGKAERILRDNCYRCHGQRGSDEGGFNYVLDPAKLIAEKKLEPGQSIRSTLIQRIVEGEMPPEGESPRPRPEDVAALKEWVDAGAVAFGAPRKSREFLSNEEVVRQIKADLARRNPLDRQFQRYFTLTHLYNAGISDDELQTYRHALSKLVNSLSWGHEVVQPERVDTAGTILRIDLRDFDWARRDVNVWENILNAYPYGVSYASEDAGYVYTNTNTRVPYVMADWFVEAASRPPLYHEVLQLPSSARDLEVLLRIDATNDIRQVRVARAGFTESGVSSNNRIIERHPSVYGSYWKSYDFKASTSEKNIFEHPLGPRGVDGSDGFVHDGAEIIFSLPNGLQGYMLVNKEGERLDKAPPEIVTDRKSRDTMVENGHSCMSCHVRGLNDKADEIRAAVESSQASFGDDVDRIRALYPEPDRFKQLVDKDNKRFRTALEQTGAPFGQTEPILALSREFEKSMDMNRVAAELGLTPQDFKQRLELASATLGKPFSPLKTRGSIKREVFLSIFSEAVKEWQRGTFIPPGQRRASGYRSWRD
jgi:mono/diheme cytochrome c family protein